VQRRHHVVRLQVELLPVSGTELSALQGNQICGKGSAMTTNQTVGSSQPVSEGMRRNRRIHEGSEALSSKAWQVATLLTPILLTTWLTFWVSQKEDSIKQHIDTQSQFFSQQLQLSEDLYKRRFDAYEKIYTQLAEIDEKLDPDQRTTETKATADNAAQLNELLNLSKLHMSANVESLSGDAFYAAARQDGPELFQRIEFLRTAMKKELDDWMLDKKLAPALPADAPNKSKAPKSNSSSTSTSTSKTRSSQ
jgi:hypothetical protein